jgi:hypothetical protein
MPDNQQRQFILTLFLWISALSSHFGVSRDPSVSIPALSNRVMEEILLRLRRTP